MIRGAQARGDHARFDIRRPDMCSSLWFTHLDYWHISNTQKQYLLDAGGKITGSNSGWWGWDWIMIV